MEHFKKLLPALYILIIFSFLLPFFNLSCGGQKVMSLTGIQLVTGTQYDQKEMFGGSKQEKVDAEPLAILALLSAIVGLVIGLIKTKNYNLASIIISAVGVILLLLLMNKLNIDITEKGRGMVTIDFLFGYWFTLLLFISSGIIHGLIYYNYKINGVQSI